MYPWSSAVLGFTLPDTVIIAKFKRRTHVLVIVPEPRFRGCDTHEKIQLEGAHRNSSTRSKQTGESLLAQR